MVYLDNFDEMEIIKKVDLEIHKEGTGMSDYHQRFNAACDEAGLPRNESKQLIHAFAGGMQGGEFDGMRGVLKLGSDKLRNYIQLSLALLARRSHGMNFSCGTGQGKRLSWQPGNLQAVAFLRHGQHFQPDRGLQVERCLPMFNRYLVTSLPSTVL